MFGKKEPTIFDKNQDRALRALTKNQSVLNKNNDYFIKDGKSQWAWIQSLKQRLDKLEQQLQQNKLADEARNQKFAQMFQGLATVSKTEEATQK